jgi:hypothetical protein
MLGLPFWRVLVLAGAAALVSVPARAQVALPGAEAAAPSDDQTAAPRPKKAKAKGEKHAKKDGAETAVAGVASIEGRPLMLNGGMGVMQVSRQGDALQIDKLSLAGEGVSDPSQRCVVNIVAEKPIAATSAGRPDGLERYQADVPACPFSFDIVSGAVLVPAQITACVFKAADCQTSPSGLWGPEGASLEADATAIGKQRTAAENAMARALRALQERAADNADASDLVRDQSAFAGQRDDTCRDYAKEATHGFCAASVTAARAALLEARLAALSGDKKDKDKAEKTAKSEKHTKHKKAKAAEAAPDAAAPDPQ